MGVLLLCWEWVKSLSRVQLFATPWTLELDMPQSMEFSRQEYWSGLPFPLSGDLPDPGIEPRSPTLQADALTSEPPGGECKLVQPFSSVLSHVRLCNTMDCSMPGLLVHHEWELTQTHVHSPMGAYLNSCPLSRWCNPAISLIVIPSPPAFNISQHQGLFKWVSSSHQVTKVLEFQLQHQSFQWIFRTDFLYDGLFGSPCNPRVTQESSPIP